MRRFLLSRVRVSTYTSVKCSMAMTPFEPTNVRLKETKTGPRILPLRHFCQNSISHAHNHCSDFDEGKLCFDMGEFDNAKDLLMKVANHNTEAQYLLGVILTSSSSAQTPSTVPHSTSDDATSVLKDIENCKKAAKLAKKVKVTQHKANKIKANSKKHASACSDTGCEHPDHQHIKEPNEAGPSDGESWLRLAASKGHPKAMCLLGNILLTKNVYDANLEAVTLYNEAVTLGQADAMFNLGLLHFHGLPRVLEPDLAKSLELFHLAADQGLDAHAMYWLGHCYLSCEGGVLEVDAPRALKYLHLSAESGHPKANYHLATIYFNGLSEEQDAKNEMMVPRNEELFRHHLTLAVEGEHPEALHLSAELLLLGDDAEDRKRALDLYEKARQLGHIPSMHALGVIHYNGMAGCPVNKSKAFEFYNEAAQLGFVEAWRNVAAMYFLGEGVPRCEDTARNIMKTFFGK